MLVEKHKEYTKEATKNLELRKNKKVEIIKGSTVNDLAEFTDTFGGAFPLSSQGNSKYRFFHNSVLYRSHFGNFTALHAMATKPNLKAEETQQEIACWLDSLFRIHTKKRINPHNEIENEEYPFSSFFNGSGITYKRLFDTSKTQRIRLRAVGMMLHIIQDSFTMSHCKRNNMGEIVQFYYYGNQDRENHKKFDHPVHSNIKLLENECRKCLKSVLAKSAYNYNELLKISRNAELSGSEAIV